MNDPAIYIYAKEIGWEEKLPCTIQYHGESFDGEIKNRGGSSSKYPKHSMTLELDDEIALAGLPKNDDWIFNASYIDKTFQRHKLSYDLFRKMHPQNKAPQCTYVPVYLNDKYIGLYVLMEKVNGSWLGFDKKNPKGARLFKDPFVFVKERLPNVQEPDNYYQQKFPKQKKLDCNHELDSLKQFLFNTDDETFGKWSYTQIDERNLIDWHLLLLLTNNDDGIFKNFYLYKEGGDQWKFIPWDYDHSFGRDGNYELNLIEREVGWEKVVLLRRLMELKQSGYALNLKRRYEELRKEVFTEDALIQMIAENERMLQPYLKENSELWPMDAKWYSDANNYNQEIEIIKKYIPMRLEQLDTFFSNLEYGEEEKE
ncbi:MAG: spore coat protein CotH [Crocinitomicaceae bacterium]